MTTKIKLPLEMVYHWEAARAESIYFTQPMGGGQVVDYTWRRAADEARRMASYLKSLNLPPKSRIGIISKNCAHWIMTDWAIWMAGHVSVPLYPTLNADTVRYVLDHSGCETLFVGKLDGWDDMKAGVPDTVHCISYPLSPPNSNPTWDDIIAEYAPLEDPVEREADEMATIVYTSGSTGRPKGVMLSFANMAHAAIGGTSALDLGSDERVLSYLPLSHVFERFLIEMGSMYQGFRIYFADSLETFVDDLRRARPTLFIAVPRIWTIFQQGVFQRMPKKKLEKLMKVPLLSGFIRKKVLTNLGLQHVRFAGSGSAPLSSDILDWYRGLGLELLEGYGMSENFGYTSMNKPGRTKTGSVGECMPGVEMKINEQGEVLVKSAVTMLGYYQDEEQTRDTMTDEGFLKTGDKGKIDDMGRLTLTGRTKEIFKTSKGKYVAPAPIENHLMKHPSIEMVCVSGENHPQPHGLIMLSEEARKRRGDEKFRRELEVSFAELLANVNKVVDPHERLLFVAVVNDEWSMENDFLTPTMKLKRNVVEDTYRGSLDSWYAERKPVIWQ